MAGGKMNFNRARQGFYATKSYSQPMASEKVPVEILPRCAN
jgi:hypothetical protein